MNDDNLEISDSPPPASSSLARVVLVAFLLTFILARLVVFLIILRKIPDLYLYIGGTHIHHLNYGIFILAIVGGYLLLERPEGRKLTIAACLYGIGLALTFDEFGMWLHLGGSYWQRASWDAITVLAAVLALVAFAPSIKRIRRSQWLLIIILLILIILFFLLLNRTIHFAGKHIHLLQPRIGPVP
jgi:hypothetical protein